MHGLPEKTYRKISEVLEKYSEVNVRLFGSRANGTYRYNSDIDLVIMNEIPDETLNKIKLELSNLNIIYEIDIVYLPTCNNESLVDSIKKEGVDY